MYSYVILVHRAPFGCGTLGCGLCPLGSVFPMFRSDEAARAARSPLLVGTMRGPHHSFVTLLCFAVQSNIQVATLVKWCGSDCLHNYSTATVAPSTCATTVFVIIIRVASFGMAPKKDKPAASPGSATRAGELKLGEEPLTPSAEAVISARLDEQAEKFASQFAALSSLVTDLAAKFEQSSSTAAAVDKSAVDVPLGAPRSDEADTAPANIVDSQSA